jgi:hypothetical protein
MLNGLISPTLLADDITSILIIFWLHALIYIVDMYKRAIYSTYFLYHMSMIISFSTEEITGQNLGGSAPLTCTYQFTV